MNQILGNLKHCGALRLVNIGTQKRLDYYTFEAGFVCASQIYSLTPCNARCIKLKQWLYHSFAIPLILVHHIVPEASTFVPLIVMPFISASSTTKPKHPYRQQPSTTTSARP